MNVTPTTARHLQESKPVDKFTDLSRNLKSFGHEIPMRRRKNVKMPTAVIPLHGCSRIDASSGAMTTWNEFPNTQFVRSSQPIRLSLALTKHWKYEPDCLIAAPFFCSLRQIRRIWRKRVGVEPIREISLL